jgi:hypothetical protein
MILSTGVMVKMGQHLNAQAPPESINPQKITPLGKKKYERSKKT